MRSETPEARERRLQKGREYTAAHRDQVAAYQKAYFARISADPELRAKRSQKQRETRKRHADKIRDYNRNRDKIKVQARRIVGGRVRRNALIKGPCEVCGDPNSQAHHHDYSKPLDIKWLCPKHHAEIHRLP